MTHEPETMRSAAGEALYCLRSFAYHARQPLRSLPLCRVGVHRWCVCCSPVYCVRCETQGHD